VVLITNTPIISVHIDNLKILKAAYMPFLINGGLFLTVKLTEQEQLYEFKQSVCLILQFFTEPKKYFCITTVAWLSPGHLYSDKSKGIGLHFDRQDSDVRLLIESKLSTVRTTAVSSQTL
jgi:type IV pilus assembly protein PilZ